MHVSCASCGRVYDLGDPPRVDSLRCVCGRIVTAVPVEARQAPILRCAACGGPLESKQDVCPFCGGAVDRRGKGGLVCPSCYAANAPDARYCTHCGRSFHAVSWEVFQTTTECPRCSVPLEGFVVEGFRYEQCRSCGGLWMDRETLREAVRRKEREYLGEVAGQWRPVLNRSNSKVQYLRCPVCGELMARKNFGKRSGVIVDECPAHGIWLDAGELDQIARFVATGGLARARREEMEEKARLARIRSEVVHLDRGRVTTVGARRSDFVSFLLDLLWS